jgi:hypothetical protein
MRRMWALWSVLVLVVLIGGFFLVKAFVKFSTAMAQLRTELTQLGEMGPRLQRLADDVGQLTDSMEERRPQ